MQILALTEGADHVCYRYRIAPFRTALEQAGIHLQVAPLSGSWQARLAQLRAARKSDVVILQRRLLPRWQLRLLRHWSQALVFDFDDAIFRRSSFSPRGTTSPGRRRSFDATVRAADLTIAGNAFLRDRAACLMGDERIRVVPTCVDVGRYVEAGHRRAGSDTKLVWIGQRSTLRYLADARPCLAEAAARVPGLTLKIIADVFDVDCGLPIVPHIWSEATEAVEIADADIGISWLSDDDWSRGKCGLKVLQYMAAGLPVVANPVGVQQEMVVDGHTGFLASTPAEWGAAIVRLARDPALRRRLGANGRRLVSERYGVARWAPEFVSAMQSLCRYEVSFTKVRLPSAAPGTRLDPPREAAHNLAEEDAREQAPHLPSAG